VQDDVEGLDLWMGGEEGFRLGHGGAGGAGTVGHVAVSKSSVRIASKAAIRRSIWAVVVAGLTSIMLWKGAIRQPRLRRAVWTAASTAGWWACVGFGAVFQRAGGADEFHARADADDVPRGLVPLDGRSQPLGQPRGTLFHAGVILRRHHLRQGGRQRRELQRVGGKGGSHAGMPRLARGVIGAETVGDCGAHPPDGGRQPACHALADDEHVGVKTMDTGIAAKARGYGMRLVVTGSVSTAATSPVFNRASTAARSLNSQTVAARVRSCTCPTSPARLAGTPSRSSTIVSSKVP